MRKRLISAFLSLVMVLSLAVSAPLAVFADTAAVQNDPSDTLGVYSARMDRGFMNSYYYSDRLFEGDAYEYNNQLARMSIELSMLSLPSLKNDPALELDTSVNLRAYLTDNGFTDYETNGKYGRNVKLDDEVAVACAHKTVTADGKKYTLLVVQPRGATYGDEWANNFTFSSSADDKGDSAGFAVSASAVLSYVKKYCAKYGISGDVKIWMSGYSRGAGIVNLAAAYLLRDPSAVLGRTVSFEPSDLYCYTLGAPRVAGASSDYDDDIYACIHNMFDSTDIMKQLPPTSMAFERFGSSYNLSSLFDKTSMLELLKECSPDKYESFDDPDEFMPLKLDTKAILKGELKFAPDPDSYIPVDSEAYVDSVTESIATVSAKASDTGDAREGYYNEYQGPLSRFGQYIVGGAGSGLNLTGMTDGKYAVPMLISMYAMFMIDKNQDNVNADMNTLIESTFNQLAYYIEDDSGSVMTQYRAIAPAYRAFRTAFFEDTGVRYVLTKDLKLYRSLFLRISKKLTQELYSRFVREMTADSGLDKAVIDQLADDDSEAMSYLFAYLLLDNSFQSREIRPFSFENEQFKQLATLAGNVNMFITYHDMYAPTAGLRAADPLYDGYVRPDPSCEAGYRRVYIPASAKGTPLEFSGAVIDESGRVAAEFRNDQMISRTDEWIGITSCDTGSWLRLPLDKEYKVVITAGSAGSYSIAVGEYGINEKEELRTVSSDAQGSWSSINAEAGDEIVLNLPAVSAVDGAYSLPSDAEYTLDRPETDPVPSWTVAKAVSSNKGTLTITWVGKGNIDRYLISISQKGSDSTIRKTTNGSTRAYLIKGLKKGKIYKCRVYAQEAYGDSFRTVSSSRVVYEIAGNVKGGYTNPKSVKTNKSSVVLKTGKSFKLKASVKKVKSGKKLLACTSAVRYISTDTGVATVSSKGVIKAKSAGSCRVYAQAANGVWKKVFVEVR